MKYHELSPDLLMQTLERLHERIEVRFPNAGLARMCASLIETARVSIAQAARMASANWPLRFIVGAIIVAGVGAQIAAAKYLHLSEFEVGLLGNLEAAVNLLILFGGAIWFLLTLEERQKRQRALDALHQLRSFAHVIDMHQLTKDPVALLQERAPPRRMSKFELSRYLDYCAEMLALIGKIAALYAERVRDPVVIETVTEIENLTNGIARKIWQKITLLGDIEEAGEV